MLCVCIKATSLAALQQQRAYRAGGSACARLMTCRALTKFTTQRMTLPMPPQPLVTLLFLHKQQVDGHNDNTTKPSMTNVIDQLGDSLWCPSSDETVKPQDVLTDKLLLLYFSASFCGPCRRFTPTLKEFYNNAGEDRDFEVVFLSMDKSQKDYDTYTSDMPWYALPHNDSCKQLTKALAARYGVQGIPYLVIFDKDGSMLQQDAVSLLMDNPEAFPWRPKPLSEALPKYYLLPDGSTLEELATLKDKYVMLYFSAHWCLPCRQFSPNLAKAYAELKELRDDFEIIFVSADDNQEEFDEYLKEMGFCAIPYDDRSAKKHLSKALGVRGIPTLVMLAPQGDDGSREVINPNCVGVFINDDYISDFPYEPKPYGDLNSTADDINDWKCLVIFHEGGDDEEQEEVMNAVKLAAEQFDGTDVKFFWALDDKGLTRNVRKAVNLGPPTGKAQMILLDVADHGSYYVSDETDHITPDSILQFVREPGTKREIQ